MKYAIVTFGCRVNQADSLRIEEQLLARGAESSPAEQADVVIVNTCSVTATADQGARQTIRRIARLNPSARVIATGCYASRQPAEVGELPVAQVVRNPEKDQIVAQLWASLGQTTATRFGDGEGACGAPIHPGLAGRTAYTLRVQTGCEEACAYCIIPTTRGASRSVPIAAVLDEVARVEAAGFREIAITGVHLGAYGRDLTPAVSLGALLTALARAHLPIRFRVSSLEPMDCPPELLDLAADEGPIAPHFHLPLQHASDRVLARMRRPYTIAQYDRLVSTIRRRLPHASIGSDLIVGFPGETDKDFRETASYLASAPLTHLHVFPYSDRPGTVAAGLDGTIEPATIRTRAREIREIGRTLTERFHRDQIGRVRPGLTIEDGSLVVTDNYLKVRIAPGHARNEPVRVRITAAGERLTGEIL